DRAAGALLQARPGALQGVRAARRRQERLGPRHLQLSPRRRAVREGQDPGGLGEPQQTAARVGPEETRSRGLEPARGGQSARALLGRRGAVRAIAVHEDVVVAIGAIWKTTCTAVRAGDEAFLIESPILPDELEALPALLDQAGFAVSGLLVTHADWDHLLGRYAFPEASIGCGETTAARLTAEPGAAQRELREFDEQYLIDRPSPLSLPGVQALPVPGYCSLGDRELELHPADGHTSDGTAVWIPWAGALVCGDYLSPG